MLKNFDEILDDYNFFARHSTEAEVGADAIASILQSKYVGSCSIDLLDFGCGDGKFLSTLFQNEKLKSTQTSVVLFDPSIESIKQSKDNLASLNFKSVMSTTAFSVISDRKFDIILANHVLYYVENLNSIVSDLSSCLKPNGKMIAVMATNDNDLIKFWFEAFALLGRSVPYHLYEDISKAFTGTQLSRMEVPIEARVVFNDTKVNRIKMAKFLTGSYFGNFDQDKLLSLFDTYQADNNIIEMKIIDKVLVLG